MEENYDRVEKYDENYNVVEEGYLFKRYYLGNILHRLNGPAIEFAKPMPGKLYKDYWFYMDIYIKCDTQEEFESIIALRAFW